MYLLNFYLDAKASCGQYILPAERCERWRVYVPGLGLGGIDLSAGETLALRYPDGATYTVGTLLPACACPLDDTTANIRFRLRYLSNPCHQSITFGFLDADTLPDELCFDTTDFGFVSTAGDVASYTAELLAYLNGLGLGTAQIDADGYVLWTVDGLAFAALYGKEVCAAQFGFCVPPGIRYQFDTFRAECCANFSPCPPLFAALCDSYVAEFYFPECLPSGDAQIILLDNDQNTVAYSRTINVGTHPYSLLMRFLNHQSAFGYPYQLAPWRFQQIRLGIELKPPIVKKKQVLSFDSTAKTKKIFSRLRYIHPFTTDYFDSELHLALANLLEHDEIYLYLYGQWLPFVHEENYNINWLPHYPLAKASSQLLAAETQGTNYFC